MRIFLVANKPIIPLPIRSMDDGSGTLKDNGFPFSVTLNAKVGSPAANKVVFIKSKLNCTAGSCVGPGLAIPQLAVSKAVAPVMVKAISKVFVPSVAPKSKQNDAGSEEHGLGGYNPPVAGSVSPVNCIAGRLMGPGSIIPQ